MSFYILIGLGGLCVLGGLFMLLKGIKENKKNEPAVVPISDLNEIQQLHSRGAPPPTEKPSTDEVPSNLNDHIIAQSKNSPSEKDNLDELSSLIEDEQSEKVPSDPFSVTQDFEKSDDANVNLQNNLHSGPTSPISETEEGSSSSINEAAYRQQILELRKENERLEAALSRELDSKAGAGLSEEEQVLLMEQQEKLREMAEKVNGLTNQNEKLQQRLDEESKSVNDMVSQFAKVKNENEQLQKELDEYHGQMDSALKKISEQEKQPQEQEEMIKHLQAENTKFQEDQKENIARIQELERKLEVLDEQKQGMSMKVSSLEEEIDPKLEQAQEALEKLSLKEQMLKELQERFKSMQEQHLGKIKELEEKLSGYIVPVQDAASPQTAQTSEQEEEKIQELKVDLEKVRGFNKFLLDKEMELQYELTKQRAQTLGWEKICNDLKTRVESQGV